MSEGLQDCVKSERDFLIKPTSTANKAQERFVLRIASLFHGLDWTGLKRAYAEHEERSFNSQTKFLHEEKLDWMSGAVDVQFLLRITRSQRFVSVQGKANTTDLFKRGYMCRNYEHFLNKNALGTLPAFLYSAVPKFLIFSGSRGCSSFLVYVYSGSIKKLSSHPWKLPFSNCLTVQFSWKTG